MAVAQLMEGVGITFGATGHVSKILSVSWTGITRATVDASDLTETGGKTFLGSQRYDPGELSVEMQYDSGQNLETEIKNNSSTAITVTWLDSAVMSASGFLTGYEVSGGDDETIKATITFKLTGTLTF